MPAGTYTVSEVQPTNYVDGTDYVGSDGGQVGNDILQTIQLGRNDFAGQLQLSEAGLIANLISKRRCWHQPLLIETWQTSRWEHRVLRRLTRLCQAGGMTRNLLAGKVRSANPTVDPVNDQSMVWYSHSCRATVMRPRQPFSRPSRNRPIPSHPQGQLKRKPRPARTIISTRAIRSARPPSNRSLPRVQASPKNRNRPTKHLARKVRECRNNRRAVNPRMALRQPAAWLGQQPLQPWGCPGVDHFDP